MKRLVSLLAILCLGALLFCACNTATPPEETDPDTTAPVTDTPTEPATEPPTEENTEAPTEESTDGETEAPTEEATTDYFEANRIETVAPDTSKAADLTLTDEGVDIYQLPGNGNGGWRYGPSYIYYGDGRVDAYFASGGDSGEWDRITYRSSTDDGKTWSAEKIVVYPTPGSMDGNSCCDPGAVYFNGYYYIGYTSTLNDGGYCNNIFVARSKNPDGPVEKWNGGKIHRIRKNVIHLMRGQVYEIDGKKLFSMGGAYSRDKYMRYENLSWWKEELPNDAEYKEAISNLKEAGNKVDYIVSHTAPREIIRRMGKYPDAHDMELTGFLEWIMHEVEFEHWYFGHWHTDRDITEKFSALLFTVKDA